MRKLISIILALCLLCCGSFVAAEASVDLSKLSYDELVSLKDQINLAIWNSAEWEEVEVPQGVYRVGVDIPAGHWVIKCANEWRNTGIVWGEYLEDSGKDIRFEGRNSYEWVYNPNHKNYKKGDGVTEYDFEVRNGDYIVIQSGSAIFMPYYGKPNLTFKKNAIVSSNTPVATAEPSKEKTKGAAETTVMYKVGDTVKLGKYEQDHVSSNGKEDIEWIVISVEKDKALLLSKMALKTMGYYGTVDYSILSKPGIYWGTSDIRKWLNGSFYESAFSADEKAMIQKALVTTSDAYGQSKTEDYLFLLSKSEVQSMKKNWVQCMATAAAIAEQKEDSGGYCAWWLRDMSTIYKDAGPFDFMSTTYNSANVVTPDGAFIPDGMMVCIDFLYCVRPALWVSLSN